MSTTASTGHAFADRAAKRIFLVVMTLRDPDLSVSKVFSLAHSGFAYQPTGLFVIPFSFAFVILLVTAFSLGRHIMSPSKLAPFRFMTLPDDQNRQRKALLAGRRLWNWGAFVFCALTIAQLFLDLRYGRLATGLLTPRMISDAAFFVLWTTAFAHVISAHHTIPLLRTTQTYDPPRVLARPLFRPFSTTATVVTFPLLLLAALASAAYYDSDGLSSLHKAIRDTARLFSEASNPGSATDEVPDATILGPASYAQMEETMSNGWKLALRGTGSAVKACALVILLFALFGVEIRAYLRYWQLSKNARREARVNRYSLDTADRRSEKELSSFRPHSRQCDNKQHSFVPTLPFHQPPPASLPMCRTATHSRSGSSSSSSGSIEYSYDHHDTYDLRSATPYTTLPRYDPSLWRSRSYESEIYADEQNPATTPSSTSTHLPYRVGTPRGQAPSASSPSASLEYLPYLPQADSPHESSLPTTPSSAYLNRAYDSQDRELEKYSLDRPHPVARRAGRETDWEGPDDLALGTAQERRTYDTLPIYASRAGSRKTKRSEWEDEECEEEERTSASMSERSWSGDSYDSRVELTRTGAEVSDDVIEERTGGGYAGPSNRCFKGMMKMRLGDALWSTGILTVFTLLFVVKALWTEQIISSRSLSFFVLIFEHTLPSIFLFVLFSITYCRRASARIDADLFKRTRWGHDLNQDGWWIPSDEAEAGTTR
ncbi:hypothetical protein JCM16303_005531 [Sporobolomyces ruberrimus]